MGPLRCDGAAATLTVAAAGIANVELASLRICGFMAGMNFLANAACVRRRSAEGLDDGCHIAQEGAQQQN